MDNYANPRDTEVRKKIVEYIYQGATVYLDRKYFYVRDYVTSERAHVKSGELLEIFTPGAANDNQQPSLLSVA